MTNRRQRRTGKKTSHICPRCAEQFVSKRKFLSHIENHDWTVSPEGRSTTALEMAAGLLLGLSTNALWDFIKWCFEHFSAEDFQRVIGDLFYINVPMGGGRSSASRVLAPAFVDETRREEHDSSLEEGLYQNIDEHDADILLRSFSQWLSDAGDEVKAQS